MTHILVAHAPRAAKRAAVVKEELAALGYEVEASAAKHLAPLSRRELDAAVAQARAVLVLWSKDAPAAPAVLAAANRAQAAGKLALARLDASAPPPRLKAAADLSAWKGFSRAKSWKRLLARLPAAPAAHAPKRAPAALAAASVAAGAPKKKGAAAIVWTLGLLTLAAAGAAAAYVMLF